MRILWVVPYDIRTVPCMTRAVELSRAVTALGHSVRLVYFHDLDRRRRFGALRPEPTEVECHELAPPLLGLTKVRRQLDELASDVDLVQFQKCHPHCALPALAVAAKRRLPVHYDWDDDEVAINRETWRSKTGRDSPLWRGVWLMERALPALSDSLSVSSEALRSRAIAYGREPGSIGWVPVGADLERFDPRARGLPFRAREGLDGPVITYLGQLEGVSHVDGLLEVAVLVAARKPEARWLIVGGGFQQSDLERRAADLGLAGTVRFLGYRPAAEVPEILAASDVMVAWFEDTPATRAKSPLKIAEYLAAGRPVVATPVGELPRMLEGAGILAQPNPPVFAAAILQLLADDEARVRLGRGARRGAEEVFNWRASARRLLNAYGTGSAARSTGSRAGD